MEIFIECPVCEQRLLVSDGPPGLQILCTSCSRSFTRSEATLVDPEKAASDQKLKVSPAMPSQVTPANSKTAQPIRPVNSAPPVEAQATVDSSARRRQKSPRQKLIEQRQKRRLTRALIFSTFLAIAIGVMIGVLIQQLKKQSTRKGILIPDNSVTAPEPTINPATEKEEQQQVPVEPEPIVVPSLRLEYLKKAQVDNCWETVRPHLVSLKVHDARGTHEAVGTIIDSRGWILTSFSAVAGATKIAVSASPKSIDELGETELLTDLVRGVVSPTEPPQKNDLVILSINRRFIVDFAFPAIASKNDLVAGSYLVQCGPPSRENPLGRTESEIMIRDNYENLSDAAQATIKHKKKLDSTDLIWLVAEGQTVPLPGTPLVSSDGTLAAVNIFSLDGRSYFVPVDQLKSQITAFDGSVRPLNALRSAISDSDLAGVSTGHELREDSVRLNVVGEQCEAFGWIPQSKKQYETLQEFAGLFSAIDDFVTRVDQDGDEQDKNLAKQATQWKDSLSKRFAALTDEDAVLLKTMNSKFTKQPVQGRGIFILFFGEVLGLDFSTGDLLAKIVDEETGVSISFDPSVGDPYPLGSQWLFVVRTDDKGRRYRQDFGDDKLIFVKADLVLPIRSSN